VELERLNLVARSVLIEPSAPLCVVMCGSVSLTYMEPDGVQRILGRVGPGAVIGVAEARAGAPALATEIASKETAVRFVSRDTLDQIAQQLPMIHGYLEEAFLP
jgi:CRP-like cAMP-binding protein